MKATSQVPQNGFRPVSVTITFETVEEARAFYAILNFIPIIDDSVIYDGANLIREAMQASTPTDLYDGGCAGNDDNAVNTLRRRLRQWYATH